MACWRHPLWVLCLAAALLAGCQRSAPPSAESAAEAGSSSPASALDATLPQVGRGQLRFVEGFRAGLDLAEREGKPMLVFFTAPWCRYCHEMADEAFTHQQVVLLSERFVCVLVDADREPQVCSEFRVRGYPTVQFLSPLGISLNRVVGKQTGHQFVIEMQAALQAVARRQLQTADSSRGY